MAKIIYDKEFKGLNHSKGDFERGNYENCTFSNCNFANADFSDLEFLECEFENCDLTMLKTLNTAFREITFKNCKMIGVHFETCNDFLFSMNTKNCQLNLSSFYKMLLKNTNFKDTALKEVDFVESNLTGANFSGCDLSGALFENTILEKADFRNAFNYIIDPEINQINGAKFSSSGIAGLLSKYNIEIE